MSEHKLEAVKVGDTVFVQPQRHRNRSEWTRAWEGPVTKVGRRWITVDRGGREQRFDRDSGRSESGENDFANGLGSYGFASAGLRQAFIDGVEERERLVGLIGSGAERWRSWDTDLLVELARLCETYRERRALVWLEAEEAAGFLSRTGIVELKEPALKLIEGGAKDE